MTEQHYQSELNEHNGFTFNSPSYRELGKRYAKEIIRLLKQPLFNPSSSVIPTKDLPNDWIIKSPSGKPFPIHWVFRHDRRFNTVMFYQTAMERVANQRLNGSRGTKPGVTQD